MAVVAGQKVLFFACVGSLLISELFNVSLPKQAECTQVSRSRWLLKSHYEIMHKYTIMLDSILSFFLLPYSTSFGRGICR